MRACQQIDDFVLGTIGFARCRKQYFLERVAACIKELGRRADVGKRPDNALPGAVQSGARNLALAGQDLPKPNVGLEDSHGVASQNVVGNLVNRFGHLHKVSDRCIAQFWKLGKDQILIAELRELVGQQEDRLGTEPFFRRPSAVQFSQRQIDLQRSLVCLRSRNGEHSLNQLLGISPVARTLSPFANNLGIAFLAQDFFPYLQVSGNVWVAVGLPLKASYQKQEAWSRPKRRPGGVGRKVGCAKRLVETPQAVRFDEVHLLTLINTREGVKISRQPALVFQIGRASCRERVEISSADAPQEKQTE